MNLSNYLINLMAMSDEMSDLYFEFLEALQDFLKCPTTKKRKTYLIKMKEFNSIKSLVARTISDLWIKD